MKKKTLSLLTITLTLLLLVQCGTTPAKPAGKKAFLWEAQKGDTRFSILGSLSLATADVYPLSAAIDAAYAAADALVVELDTIDADNRTTIQQLTFANGMFGAGETIADCLAPATLEKLAQAVGTLRISLEAITRMKPWLIQAMLITLSHQQAGYDPLLGMDIHFLNRAQADNKPVIELETVEEQLELLAGISLEKQVRALEFTLADLPTVATDGPALTAAWQKGAPEEYTAIANGTFTRQPEFQDVYQRLVVERNLQLAGKIAKLSANSGRYFVVVGASSLGGTDGLLALLKARGYAVRQL